MNIHADIELVYSISLRTCKKSLKVNFTDKNYRYAASINIACVPSVFLVSSVTVYSTHGISKIATCCCI